MSFPTTFHCFLILLFYVKGEFSTASKLHLGDAPSDDDKMEDDNNDDYDDEMTDNGDDDYTDANYEDDIPKAEANLGKHYFQGDMLTTNNQIGKINKLLDPESLTSANQPQLRALVKDISRTWKNGVIPYTIKHNVDNYRRTIVKEAIKHWETKTCLRFRKRTFEKDYVQFEEKDGCASFVGRIGGKQEIIVGNTRHTCRVGNIIHEIGHTIGFFHEQSRPDRNKFVKIKWNNVLKGYRVNFVMFPSSIIDSREVGYDYGSIMHYPRKIFGKKPRKPTVVPIEHDAYIGQRIALSPKDILQVGKMYGCKNKTRNNPM